jgi:hypothetical protein
MHTGIFRPFDKWDKTAVGVGIKKHQYGSLSMVFPDSKPLFIHKLWQHGNMANPSRKGFPQ